MSWARAKVIAARYAASLNLPSKLDGVTVKLTDYESETTHSILKQGSQWGLEFERMVTRAFQRDLIKRGATVEIVTVKLEEYLGWLKSKDLPNTSAHRAQFIVELTSTK